MRILLLVLFAASAINVVAYETLSSEWPRESQRKSRDLQLNLNFPDIGSPSYVDQNPDFESVNEFLKDVSVLFPSSTFEMMEETFPELLEVIFSTEGMAFPGLVLAEYIPLALVAGSGDNGNVGFLDIFSIQSFLCQNGVAKDAQIYHESHETGPTSVFIDFRGLGVTCKARWKYKEENLLLPIAFLPVPGEITFNVRDFSIMMEANVETLNVNALDAFEIAVDDCDVEIFVETLQTSGLLLRLYDSIFDQVQLFLARGFGDSVCSYFRGPGVESLRTLVLNMLNDMIKESSGSNDSLSLQKYEETNILNTNYINFNDDNCKFSTDLKNMTTLINSKLGGIVADETSTLIKDTDIGINELVRKKLIDSENKIEVPFEKLHTGPILVFDGEATSPKTKFFLRRVEVEGLDTFKKINVLEVIGDQTLKIQFHLQNLKVSGDAIVQVESTDQFSSSEMFYVSLPYQERNMQFDALVQDLQITASLYLGIDADTFKEMRLGSNINSDCSLNFLKSFGLTQLETFFILPEMPRLTGFNSPGITELFSNVTTAFSDVVNLESFMPVLGSVLKEIIQNQTTQMIEDMSDECPIYEINQTNPFLDFRILLNSSFEVESENSKKSSYGSLIPYGVESLRYYEQPNDDGSPLMNEYLLGRGAKLVSNETGSLFFETNVGCEAIVDNSEIDFVLKDVLLENLDSVGYPLGLLKTRINNPYVIDNAISLGKGKPLKLIVNADLSVELEGVRSYNAMKISIHVNDLVLISSVLAKVNEAAFLNFPMNDVTNLYCWQSLLAGPETGTLDDSSSVDTHFDILDFDITSDAIDINVECLPCETAGIREIPEVLNRLREEGFLKAISTGIYALINEQLKATELSKNINEMAKLARYKCPHDPLFHAEDFDNQPTAKMDCSNLPALPPLPNLSMESIQFVSLLLSILIQLGTVILPLSLVASTYEVSDPLSGQAFVGSQEMDQFVDFRNSEAFGFVDAELRKIDHHAANKMVPLDDSGWLNFPLGITILEEGAHVVLESIGILGLNSMKHFDVLRAIDAQTLQSKISISNLKGVVNLLLKPVESTKQEERLTLSIELRDINIAFALFAALKNEYIAELQLGSFLDFQDVLPCLFSPVHAVNVTQLIVEFDEISHVEVIDFLEDNIARQLSVFSKGLIDSYRSQILTTIPQVLDSFVREFINARIGDVLNDYNGQLCPQVTKKQQDKSFIDFNQFFHHVQRNNSSDSNLDATCNTMCTGLNLMREQLLSPDIDGSPSINSVVIAPFTKSSSSEEGVLKFPGLYFSESIYIEAMLESTEVKIDASNGKIENLNSFGYPLQFMEARKDEPFMIDNSASIGFASKPLKLSTRLSISVNNSATYAFNDILLNLELSDVSVVTSILAKIDEYRLFSMGWIDMTNPFCWLSAIPARKLNERGVAEEGDDNPPSLSIADIDISMLQVKLGLECIDCSSPLLQDIDSFVSSDEGIEQTTSLLLAIKDYVLQNPNIERLIQNFIDRSVHEARIQCPRDDKSQIVSMEGSPDYIPFEDTPIGSESIEVISLMLPCIAIILILNLMYRRLQRRINRKFQELLSKDENLYRSTTKLIRNRKNQNTVTSSLLFNKHIPIVARYGIVVLLLISILFFVHAHVAMGGVVDIYAFIAGELIWIRKVDTLFAMKAVTDMWYNGSKFSSIAIFAWSIVWPYIRQVSTLILWCVPSSRISADRRSSLLFSLDGLAKWSFCDIYTLLVMLVVTSLRGGTVNNAILVPDHFVDVRMIMNIEMGMYSNMIGQILSQVISHVIVYYDRKAKAKSAEPHPEGDIPNFVKVKQSKPIHEENAETNFDKESHTNKEGRKALYEYMFTSDTGQILKIHKFVNLWIMIYAMILLAVLMSSMLLPTFQYEVQGLLGFGIQLSGYESRKGFDLFTAVGVILKQAKFLNTMAAYVGLGFMSFLLIFTTLVIGIIIIGLLLSVWFIPMTKERRRFLHVCIEIAQAWQYVEVYIFAVFLTLIQLAELAYSLVASNCEDFQDVFRMLLHFDVLNEDTAACLLLKADFDVGIYLLLLYCVMLQFFLLFVKKAIAQQEEENSKGYEKGFEMTEASMQDDGVEDDLPIAPKDIKKEIQFTDLFWKIMYIVPQDK